MSALVSEQGKKIELTRLIEQGDIRTVFQPIVCFDHESPKIFGLEALTRGPVGHEFEEAQDLFNEAENMDKLYDLERVSRELAISRIAEKSSDEKIFLNLDPNVIYDDSFNRGNTLEYLRQHGVERDRIVFEITERNRIKDRDAFEKSLHHYRNQGFEIAVDDVGSGYSNLDKIADLQPDYIKLDMSIVRNLHIERSSFQLVETLINFAETIGARVIAEGIECKEELQTLLTMGIEFGQGFFLGRPSSGPSEINDDIAKIHQRCLDTSHSRQDQPKLGELARPSKAFEPGALTKDVYRFFENHEDERSVVILQDEIPVGLVMKSKLFQQLSTNIGKSLYWERSIDRIMNEDPLLLSADTDLAQASEMVVDRRNEDLYDEVVVYDPENNRYRGNVTVRKILEKITKLKTRKARRANPLTGLPGNVEIQDKIQENLDNNRTFGLIYVDLDHFKPFNDYYGFERGDKAILLLKNTLRDALQRFADPSNFLGHVGGDDFVFITAAEKVDDICKYIIDQFDERIVELYDPQDLDDGTIELENRQGNTQTFNIMTVSLAVVTNEERSFKSHLKMSEVAAEVKKYVKQDRQKSSYEIDRRTD